MAMMRRAAVSVLRGHARGLESTRSLSMQHAPSLFRVLTDEQARVATATANFLGVIGAPGSGKTMVAAARVERLVADGVDPATIALLAPSTEGAARLRALADAEAAHTRREAALAQLATATAEEAQALLASTKLQACWRGRQARRLAKGRRRPPASAPAPAKPKRPSRAW